jgi:ADP-heptose:LPS heptosyltransferase
MIKKSSNIKHLVIPFIDKGIGDAIVISGFIDILTKNNYQVSVIADHKTHFLFKDWNNIDNLFLYSTENENHIINNLKNIGKFIFIDPHEITHSSIHTFNIIRRSKPSKTIGFNDKYSVYDDIIGMSQPLGHASIKCLDLLYFLGIKITTPYNYIIHIPEKNKKEAESFIRPISDKKIISFIPYGSISTRSFSEEQINSILRYFSQYANDIHVIIIGEQDKTSEIETGSNVSKNTYHSFLTAAQIIKESHLVITPDTSIVHLSRVFRKRMICFYPFKMMSNGKNNADVWGPNYDEAVQIRLSENNLSDADVDLLIGHIHRETDKIRV